MIAANQIENFRNSALSAGARLAGLKGDWERAYSLRQDFLRANPTDPLVHTGIAECLRELGRLAEAEQAIRLTLQRIPGSAAAYVELAQVLEARGDAAGARTALERALADVVARGARFRACRRSESAARSAGRGAFTVRRRTAALGRPAVRSVAGGCLPGSAGKDRCDDRRGRSLHGNRPSLPARSGVPVEVEFATTAALVERLTNGEAADLAILTKEAVQQLAAKGHVRSSTDLVLSVIGIAVADDAPLPAMKTTEDFVAFMKATPSIAYTVRGVSGLHMAQLIEQLGLAAVVKPKAVVVDGFSGTLLREGKVAAAVQQISELRFTGAKNIVPLPDEIQVQTIFTVAVLNGATSADSAAKVVRVLTSSEAAAAYERSGASPLFK